MSYRLFACTLIGLTFFSQPASGEVVHLRFGVYTSDKPSTMYRMFKPVLVELERLATRELGREVKIKLRIFKTYDGANDALVSGEVDFVRFGPASYIIAKERNPEIRILAVEKRKGDSPYRFNGVIFTRKESPVKTLADLKGRSFAFGDEFSTIGRYLAQAELVKAGIYARDLARYEYLGRHDLVVTAVLHGKFDAGSAKESTYRKYEAQGLRPLLTFPNHTKPWLARAGLEPEIAGALRQALLSIENPDVLRALGKKVVGFGVVPDSSYDFVREGMERARAFTEGPEAAGARTGHHEEESAPEAGAPAAGGAAPPAETSEGTERASRGVAPARKTDALEPAAPAPEAQPAAGGARTATP